MEELQKELKEVELVKPVLEQELKESPQTLVQNEVAQKKSDIVILTKEFEKAKQAKE